MNPREAVFFIGFGGPEKREDVLPFLEIVTRGRGIPKERLEDVARHYEAIGGASPINEITRRQAEALEGQLRTATQQAVASRVATELTPTDPNFQFAQALRRGWDSNPRGAFTPTAFRERRLQPLGHLSAQLGHF